MLDLDQQIRALARALDAEAPPVTADEVRRPNRPSARPSWLGAVRPLAAAVAALLVLGAGALVWSQDDDGGDTVSTPSGSYPLTLDGHVAWFVALLNGDVDADSGEVAQRFTPEFLAAVPPEVFTDVLTELAADAPWTAIAPEIERREGSVAVQLVGRDSAQARLTVGVDATGRAVAATVLRASACTELLPPSAVTIEPAQQAQLDWVLDVVNSDREITDEELAEHVDTSLADALPPDEARAQIAGLRELVAPIVPRYYEGAPRDEHLDLRVGTRYGEEARLSLSFDAEFELAAFTLYLQPPCEMTNVD